jgi:hypothetical protein
MNYPIRITRNILLNCNCTEDEVVHFASVCEMGVRTGVDGVIDYLYAHKPSDDALTETLRERLVETVANAHRPQSKSDYQDE